MTMFSSQVARHHSPCNSGVRYKPDADDDLFAESDEILDRLPMLTLSHGAVIISWV